MHCPRPVIVLGQERAQRLQNPGFAIGIEELLDAGAELFGVRTLESFCEMVLARVATLLGGGRDGVVFVSPPDSAPGLGERGMVAMAANAGWYSTPDIPNPARIHAAANTVELSDAATRASAAALSSAAKVAKVLIR